MPLTHDPRLRLVFGASGYIGTYLVPRLLAAGAAVRVSSRHPRGLEARGWPGVEIVGADALDPDSLPAALAGVSIAYYLVHSMGAGKHFGRLDLEAAANFADAAAAAGVERICYLGGLVPEDATSEHIVSRRDTGEVLRQGRVPVTEIRAGIIVGPGSAAFEVMRDLVYHLPVMITPRWVTAKSPPVALDNLLDYLVMAPGLPETANRVPGRGRTGGTDLCPMMRILAEAAGRRPPWIIPVPVLSPQAVGLLAALRHRRADQRRPRPDRGPEARLYRPPGRTAAPGPPAPAELPRVGRRGLCRRTQRHRAGPLDRRSLQHAPRPHRFCLLRQARRRQHHRRGPAGGGLGGGQPPSAATTAITISTLSGPSARSWTGWWAGAAWPAAGAIRPRCGSATASIPGR